MEDRISYHFGPGKPTALAATHLHNLDTRIQIVHGEIQSSAEHTPPPSSLLFSPTTESSLPVLVTVCTRACVYLLYLPLACGCMWASPSYQLLSS